jgi:hypothetical protein
MPHSCRTVKRHWPERFQGERAYPDQEFLSGDVLFLRGAPLADLSRTTFLLGAFGRRLLRVIQGFPHELISVPVISRILLQNLLQGSIEITGMHS